LPYRVPCPEVRQRSGSAARVGTVTYLFAIWGDGKRSRARQYITRTAVAAANGLLRIALYVYRARIYT
jgi:hypothetical protein